MNQENKTLLVNLNHFGPIFSESQRERLLSKSAREDMQDHEATYIEHLEDFLGKNFEDMGKNEIRRYCEITDEKTHLGITPSPDYENLYKRVIHPIILGKKYFALGNYLSCIAMAGLAAEMMTFVMWGMSTFSIAGEEMNEEQQNILFGQRNQERTIKILCLTKAIQEEDAKMLEEIRSIRNKYTHAWDIPSDQDKGNAKKVIRYSLILFKNISGIDLYIDNDGKQQLRANPKFLNFLSSIHSKD